MEKLDNKLDRKRKKKPVRKLNIVMRKKLVGLMLLVLLALVALSFRITYINASRGTQYRKQVLAQSQQVYNSTVLPYKRGDIYDRNGTTLATSNKVYNVIMDCKVVNSGDNGEYIEPTVNALVDIFGLDEEELLKYLTDEGTKSSQYVIVAKNVSMDQKKEFEEYCTLPEGDEDKMSAQEKALKITKENIQGIWFEEDYLRTYPLNELACEVIGFTVDGNLSDWGIEGQYSSTLNGVDGRSYGAYSDSSSVEETIIQPTNGSSIVSTIDVGAQQIVEKYIQAFMEKMGAENVGVVVMDPNNGEVLAMASQDSYDLNNPQDLTGKYTQEQIDAMTEEETSEALNEMWSNFCVTEAYEPGSVVKPIIMSAALEYGVVSENDQFVCDGGQSFGESTYIKCTGEHGDEALKDIIANSCNDGMMQIGAKIGAEKFLSVQSLFNLGTRTGIDLPNEGTGIVHTESSMGVTELACSAFGQGFTCTMIQELSAMCSVINGGYYYQPHVVSKILNSDGSVAKTITPTVMKQTIASNISAEVRSFMEASVQEGTSVYSKVEGYSSGGKTGTAEKLPRDNGKYLVSFIGFSTVDDPQVAIYVVVDEPKADRQDNSAYAQYIAQAIMSELLPYLNVTPDEAEDGVVPSTTLWNLFKGVASSTDDESLATISDDTTPIKGSEVTDDEETTVIDDGTGSYEGTDDPNIPEPLEEDEEAQRTYDEETGGVTNEEADMGW